MNTEIRTAVQKALQALDIPECEFSVEHPPELSHGDFATNVALVVAKSEKKNPRELAAAILEKLEGAIPDVDHMEIAGAGFINFFLTRDFFKEKIAEARKFGESWGRNESLSGKRIMVEYTQPNPFKVFHIGHLMSNTIGESLSRIIEASGAEVFRANYQGDVGLHIGKTMWGLQELQYDPMDISKVGEAYAYGHKKYEEDDVAKQEIIALTKKVYAKDADVMDVYTKGRDASLKHFDEIYARVGTAFDQLFFEGETWKKGKEVVEANIGGIFEESEGAIVYKGEQDGLHTRVFINSEGVTTYEAKDVGLAYTKKDTWDFDESIMVTAVEQDQYFKVIFSALEKLDTWFKGKLGNVAHGMMMLPEGKMSSRTGSVVTGESMLDEARDAALLRVQENEHVTDKEKTADMIGVAALKYMILRQSLRKNTVYDLERALSFEGDSGPYIQYTNARINSVLAKATEAGVAPNKENAPDEPYEIEKMVYIFPEVVAEACADREPHKIVTYVTELASAFNAFYAHEKIADDSDEYAPYKVAVTGAVGTTLKNGLWMLGIKTPEKM